MQTREVEKEVTEWVKLPRVRTVYRFQDKYSKGDILILVSKSDGIYWTVRYIYISEKYGMGHEKVPVFCKTKIVQRKFCVLFPCLFHFTYFRVFCVSKIILCACGTVQEKVKRTLYSSKAGARKLLISKELPISENEVVFSNHTKRRILVLRRRGNYPPTISRLPQSDGIRASWRGILKFLLRYKQSCTIRR